MLLGLRPREVRVPRELTCAFHGMLDRPPPPPQGRRVEARAPVGVLRRLAKSPPRRCGSTHGAPRMGLLCSEVAQAADHLRARSRICCAPTCCLLFRNPCMRPRLVCPPRSQTSMRTTHTHAHTHTPTPTHTHAQASELLRQLRTATTAWFSAVRNGLQEPYPFEKAQVFPPRLELTLS
jgi:hypothetical protein